MPAPPAAVAAPAPLPHNLLVRVVLAGGAHALPPGVDDAAFIAAAAADLDVRLTRVPPGGPLGDAVFAADSADDVDALAGIAAGEYQLRGTPVTFDRVAPPVADPRRASGVLVYLAPEKPDKPLPDSVDAAAVLDAINRQLGDGSSLACVAAPADDLGPPFPPLTFEARSAEDAASIVAVGRVLIKRVAARIFRLGA